MSEELVYIMQYLSSEGFVIKSPQNYFMFTSKFYNEYTGQDIGAIPVSEIQMVKTLGAVITMPTKASDVKQAYLEFIKSCNIPKRAETSSNEVYNLNQYSEKGAKAFKKILDRVSKGEIDLQILVKSTQLYYKSPSYKLKVGNYIGEGAWETHYQEMMDSIESNSLRTHIKDSIEHDNTGTSRYSSGELGGQSPSEDPRRTLRQKPGLSLPAKTD
jgi:hypothetical protein